MPVPAQMDQPNLHAAFEPVQARARPDHLVHQYGYT